MSQIYKLFETIAALIVAKLAELIQKVPYFLSVALMKITDSKNLLRWK